MISSYLKSASETYRLLAESDEYPRLFETLAQTLCETLERRGKVLLAGNGGSAADCQHIAGELVVRFRKNRPGLPAIALTVDTSVLTACLNDFGPDPVFARQVEALGAAGDIFWALSTSGNSANILVACEAARDRGMRIIGFSGGGGGKLPGLCDYCFLAPSDVTSHIQECHIAVAHMLCLEVEERLFP